MGVAECLLKHKSYWRGEEEREEYTSSFVPVLIHNFVGFDHGFESFECHMIKVSLFDYYYSHRGHSRAAIMTLIIGLSNHISYLDYPYSFLGSPFFRYFKLYKIFFSIKNIHIENTFITQSNSIYIDLHPKEGNLQSQEYLFK